MVSILLENRVFSVQAFLQNLHCFLYNYSTTQLQLHFYTHVHAWQHAVFRVLNAKVFHGKYYLHVTRHGVSMR